MGHALRARLYKKYLFHIQIVVSPFFILLSVHLNNKFTSRYYYFPYLIIILIPSPLPQFKIFFKISNIGVIIAKLRCNLYQQRVILFKFY